MSETGAVSGAGAAVSGAGVAGTGDTVSAVAAPVVRRPATDAERRALASIVRIRILRLCLYEELTNRELAERLGRNPATVLHHVRTLVDQGFLVAGEPRRGKRGSREIPYRATGKSWTLDLDDPETGAPSGEVGRLLLATFLEEVAEAPPADLYISRLGLQLSEEHFEELNERLTALLNDYAAKAHDPDGRRWSLLVAMHPQA